MTAAGGNEFLDQRGAVVPRSMAPICAARLSASIES